MQLRLHAVITGTLLLIQGLFAVAQEPTGSSTPVIVQATLIAPGSTAFHMKAIIYGKG